MGVCVSKPKGGDATTEDEVLAQLQLENSPIRPEASIPKASPLSRVKPRAAATETVLDDVGLPVTNLPLDPDTGIPLVGASPTLTRTPEPANEHPTPETKKRGLFGIGKRVSYAANTTLCAPPSSLSVNSRHINAM